MTLINVKDSLIFNLRLGAAQLFAQDMNSLMNISRDDQLNVEVTTASKASEAYQHVPDVAAIVTKHELKRFWATKLSDLMDSDFDK